MIPKYKLFVYICIWCTCSIIWFGYHSKVNWLSQYISSFLIRYFLLDAEMAFVFALQSAMNLKVPQTRGSLLCYWRCSDLLKGMKSLRLERDDTICHNEDLRIFRLQYFSVSHLHMYIQMYACKYKCG